MRLSLMKSGLSLTMDSKACDPAFVSSLRTRQLSSSQHERVGEGKFRGDRVPWHTCAIVNARRKSRDGTCVSHSAEVRGKNELVGGDKRLSDGLQSS